MTESKIYNSLLFWHTGTQARSFIVTPVHSNFGYLYQGAPENSNIIKIQKIDKIEKNIQGASCKLKEATLFPMKLEVE